jgi:hypothetical protein
MEMDLFLGEVFGRLMTRGKKKGEVGYIFGL